MTTDLVLRVNVRATTTTTATPLFDSVAATVSFRLLQYNDRYDTMYKSRTKIGTARAVADRGDWRTRQLTLDCERS